MSSTKAPAFAAFKFVGFRFHVITYMLAMMADSVEHVISYWMLYQKFHSPELAGFAVLSHWLPFLFFSVPAGALADKYDPRRLIQAGIALFMICSLSWAYLFITDTVEQWHAMILLVLHGFAGVLWHTISQILLYDIVDASVLPSAVRILASARYLGLLIGPAVGAGLMLTVGPKYGLIVNAFLYLPTILWLATAPYGPAFRVGEAPVKRAVKGFQDIVQTIRDISGKGVATAAGVLFGIHWILGLAALSTWLIMAFFFRYSSLAALTTAIFAPLYAYFLFFTDKTVPIDVCMAVLGIGILLIWRHQSNIQKLMLGTEGKIGQKK